MGTALASVRMRSPTRNREWFVNEPDDPGLDVVATTEIDEEGALDVDVPELVGMAALVTRSRGPGNRASATAPVLEQLINVSWADLVDLAPAHLRSDPLGVPVGVQANGDDDHVNPGRGGLAQALRLSRSLHQSLDPPGLVSRQPAVEGAWRDAKLCRSSLRARLARQADSSHTEPDFVELLGARRWMGGAPVLGSQEEEAWPLLVVVPADATVRIGRVELGGIRHGRTLEPGLPYVSRNFS